MTSLSAVVLENPVAATIAATGEPENIWKNIAPVPLDAPRPNFIHPKHGKPCAIYEYKSSAGLARYVCRYELPDSTKQFCPYTLWQNIETGEFEWQRKDSPAPKTLYGLELLQAAPDSPVVVTEGEKACEAARKLLPDHIVMTSSGGANAAGKSDWSGLKSRKVYIWPDADDAGMTYAKTVIKELSKHGISAYMVNLPAEAANGWDAADALQQGWDTEKTLTLLEGAKIIRPATRMPPGYFISGGYLYHQSPDDDSKPRLRLASAIEVVAYTRSSTSVNWGRLLKWHDRDGKEHEWAMPMEMLSGDGAEVIASLMREGVIVAPGKTHRTLFLAYLQLCEPYWSATCADKIGWHGSHYVFHDAVVPETDEIYLQNDSSYDYAYNCAGTLANWQKEVGSRAKGNSRLILALCAAFAAPLLRPTNNEGGCYHLRGASSIGKTTALLVASSVWGGGNKSYIQQWRSTSNALEITAEAHNDALLCLDEFAQADAKDADHVAYMLANGSGKNRMKSRGGARNKHQWLNLALSSGELSLEQKLAEAGKQIKAGMEIRFIDIPADTLAGHGLFENISEFQNSAELAKHLATACKKYYGTPIRYYLSKLCELNHDEITHDYKYYRDEFISNYLPENSDSQVKRVADRMGLLVTAGIFAVRFGVIELTERDIYEGIGRCFKAWLEARGTYGNAEVHRLLNQIGAFFQQSQHRFVEIIAGSKSQDIIDDTKTVIAPVGYKQVNSEGEYEYFVPPELFKKEICKGYDYGFACRELMSRKLLITDNDGRSTRVKRIRNIAKRARYMHFASAVMEDMASPVAEL